MNSFMNCLDLISVLASCEYICAIDTKNAFSNDSNTEIKTLH